MTSTIDPTHPLDEIPASKADLRANLAAAKVEIEHGGFAEGLSPANYGPPATSRTIDHLQAIDDALGAGVGGVKTFADLDDTPSDYTGQANRYPRVRADETGLEFVDQAAGGDVSTMSYTAAGTGATTRTVKTRLDDVISVKSFGATGDGSTDDTSAIQAALDYALAYSVSTAICPTVYFPPGSYRISATLDVSSVSLRGCGQGSEIKALAGFGPSTITRNYNGNNYAFASPMLLTDGVSAIGGNLLADFQNLYLDGLNAAPVGLMTTCAANMTFRNIRVINTASHQTA